MKSQYLQTSIEVIYIKVFNLEWYRMFMHIARHGNFTKAAQELHLTQPTVSYAMKQMEEELGIKLFHRLSKGVELTREGKSLLSYVEQSFALLESARKHVSSLKQLTEGEVRIGASDSLIKHLLLPQLNRFRRNYPGIRIRLSHGKTPDLIHRLKDGQIDCAVVHLPVEDDPQLEIRSLAQMEDCLVVGGELRNQTEAPLSAGELAKLPLLLLSPGSSTRGVIEKWFVARGFEIKPDIELGSIDLLVEFARQGFGAAFLPRAFVQEELKGGDLAELKLEEPLPPRTVGLAARRDIGLSLAADQFVGMLGLGIGRV